MHVSVGREMREENGNKLLLSTYYMLDTCYVIHEILSMTL